MKRRSFLKSLLNLAAVVAIAPRIAFGAKEQEFGVTEAHTIRYTWWRIQPNVGAVKVDSKVMTNLLTSQWDKMKHDLITISFE